MMPSGLRWSSVYVNGSHRRPRSHRSDGVSSTRRANSPPNRPLNGTSIEIATDAIRIHFTPRVKGGRARFPIGMEERGGIEGNLFLESSYGRGRSR